MNVRLVATAGTVTDRSGNITAGATSQVVAVQNLSREFLLFQNTSDTAMYVNFGAAATTTNGVLVAAGTSLSLNGPFVPSDSVNVLCATTGKTFVCKEG
jgi:hypothetical protein